MDKSQISRIKNIYGTLNNERRIELLLLCAQKDYTVTELSKKLKVGYVTTAQYIGQLFKVGLIEKIRNPDRTVTIKPLYAIDTETAELKKIKQSRG